MPDQPKQLGGTPKEPVIYTIPEQFYGLAAKAQLPKEAAAPVAAAVATGAVQAPPAPAAEKKGSKAWILIPIIALLLVVGLGFLAWYLLKPKPAPAPAQPSVTLPTVTQPEPEPEPEPEPQPEPATTTEEVPPVSAPTADGDADGLTTAEETLFGTDERKGDSDDDGFSDAIEVTNLYNPAGFRPTRLIEAGLVASFSSPNGTFSALYPSAWIVAPAEGEGDGLLVRDAATEDAFGAILQENPDGQSLLDWYLSRNPNVSAAQIQQSSTKSGLDVLRGPDENGVVAAYVDLGDGAIYRLTYAQGAAGTLYRATFTMFINSFSALP